MTPDEPTPPAAPDAEVVSPAAQRAESERAARGAAPPSDAAPSPNPPAGPPWRHTVHRAAWVLAVAADFVQWVAFPFFFQGAASPFNDALDVGIGLTMIFLCGFHWAFLPTFLAELIPGVNLVPTWTLAVWLATRGRGGDGRKS